MKRKRKQFAETKTVNLQQKLMHRFIREIEREDPLDQDTLKTMFALQAQTVKY